MAKVKPVGLFLIFPCVALHKGDPQGSPGLGGGGGGGEPRSNSEIWKLKDF